MTTFLMYLIAKLDNFSTIMSVISAVSGIVVAVVSAVYIATLMEMKNSYYRQDAKHESRILNSIRLPFLKVFIISTTLAVFLPTTKQAAFIWVAPQIIENGAVKDTVANIPELTKLGTEYLKQMLKDEINDNKNSTNAGENS